jgi:hypothetical protein
MRTRQIQLVADLGDDLMEPQICLCGAQSGYPHAQDCPYPMYWDRDDCTKRWEHARIAKFGQVLVGGPSASDGYRYVLWSGLVYQFRPNGEYVAYLCAQRLMEYFGLKVGS